MKNFEERYTQWLDGSLPEPERERFERELENREEAARDRKEWSRLRKAMRETLVPDELAHGDFVNSQVLRAIRADAPPARPASQRGMFPFGRLAWAGVVLVAVAGILSAISLTSNPAPTEEQFISQVISARSADPHLSAYTFKTSGDPAAVLWIEHAGFIPGNEQLK